MQRPDSHQCLLTDSQSFLRIQPKLAPLNGDCRHEDKGYRAQLIGQGSFRHDTQRNKFPDNDEAGQPPTDFAQLTCRGYDSGLA
jgi:hypothetical protein